LVSAVIVNVPPASRLTKSLKLRPYTSRSPTTPWLRVFLSGGPPSTSSPATGFKSLTVFSLYLSAVALVTATTSLSSAGDGVSIEIPDGNLPLSSVVTASVVAAVDFGSR